MPDADKSATYAVIAAAIDYLHRHQAEQPNLAQVAAHVGLSEGHFQRLFSAWVGISPKSYLAHLTAHVARAALAQQVSVLDAALAAGLSGPSRLHDLMIRFEGMTPGEFGRGGAGLILRKAWVDSPFGPAVVFASMRGICGLGFAGAGMTRAEAEADLHRRWPRAQVIDDPSFVEPLAAAAFARRPVVLAPIGTAFQLQVWRALINLPTGGLVSYGGLAAALGRPHAARAVGTAVGQNPISWLIPCHRVLRRDGALGGYHWGLPLKRAMLAAESARAEANAAP